MKIKKTLATAVVAATALAGLAACSDADTVSQNLSTEADNFKVWRQVVLYNAITDKYIVEIDGYCALGNADKADRVSVICRVADGTDASAYTKDIYTKSDNTIVFVHQVAGVHVSPDHYKVVLKPETVIPDFELR